jgi:hypothetical protein
MHEGGKVEDDANLADYPYMTPSQLHAADAASLQNKKGNNAVSANETLTPSGPLGAADSGSGGPADECTYSIMEDTANGRYWASSCSTAPQTAAQIQATGGLSDSLPNVRDVINSIMASTDASIFNKQPGCSAARWVGPNGQHQSACVLRMYLMHDCCDSIKWVRILQTPR